MGNLTREAMLDYICDDDKENYIDYEFYEENEISDEEIELDYMNIKIAEFFRIYRPSSKITKAVYNYLRNEGGMA